MLNQFFNKNRKQRTIMFTLNYEWNHWCTTLKTLLDNYSGSKSSNIFSYRQKGFRFWTFIFVQNRKVLFKSLKYVIFVRYDQPQSQNWKNTRKSCDWHFCLVFLATFKFYSYVKKSSRKWAGVKFVTILRANIVILSVIWPHFDMVIEPKWAKK